MWMSETGMLHYLRSRTVYLIYSIFFHRSTMIYPDGILCINNKVTHIVVCHTLLNRKVNKLLFLFGIQRENTGFTEHI